MIIINTKNYLNEKQLIQLAKKIEKVNRKTILAVPAIYLKSLKKSSKLKIIAQHIDPLNLEASTGSITVKAIKSLGISGSLINHSEYPLLFGEIQLIVNECKKNNLQSIVCSSSLSEIKQLKKLNPTAIAFESPELIGTGKSITSSKIKTIKKFVKLLENSKIIPLCGAGISSKRDIQAAYELGCKGVLIASAIAKKGKIEILK